MNMFRLLMVSFLLLIGTQTMGQDSIPPFLKNKQLPAFDLLLTDSSKYSSSNAYTYPYYTLIYFSPECGHCLETTEQLIRHSDSLQNTLLVMAAYKTVDELSSFSKKYHLNLFQNVLVGRDTRYFIAPFYRISYTPFVALYDANRRLVQYWSAPDHPFVIGELIALLQRK
jgi:hypothetical protein